MLDIPLCFTYIFAWDCLLTLVFNQSWTIIVNIVYDD